MEDRNSHFMDQTISDPWFNEMDNNEGYREKKVVDWFPTESAQIKQPGTVSINNAKYYNLPCNCGLVDNITTYRKLRTQIYFDTYTKNFYKSDINSTVILPNGLPYMICPRHSQYFSDVIRSYTEAGKRSETLYMHQKIVLFDGNSQHSNYSIPNPSFNNDDANIGDIEMLKDDIGSPFNTSISNRYIQCSPDNTFKHFPTCSINQNENSVCNCDEQLSIVHQNYVRENSVVADVLGDHGVDVVIPPQDFYMLNNPLFKDQNRNYSGTRLAKARWVRRNSRLKSSPKNNDHNSSRYNEKSNINKIGSHNDYHNEYLNIPTNGDHNQSTNVQSNINDFSYNNRLYFNDPTLSINNENSDYSSHSQNNSNMISKNATFTVFTRPKRHHSENDEFTVDSYTKKTNPNRANKSVNNNRTYVSSYSNSKCLLPEEDLERWVTIIGFQPRSITQIIRYMGNFGPIIKIKTSKTCNYMHLMYSKRDCAEKAVQKGTINLDNNIIVGIKPCANTFIPNEHVQSFDDNTNSTHNSSILNVSNYFSWFKSAIFKVANYVDEFINEP